MRFLPKERQRLSDNCKQSLLVDINVSSKCTIYRYFIDHCTLHSFLTRNFFQYKKFMCKSCNSLSRNCLNEEIGGYTNKCSIRKTSVMYILNIRWIIFYPEMSIPCHTRKKKSLRSITFNKLSVFVWIKLLLSQSVKGIVQI